MWVLTDSEESEQLDTSLRWNLNLLKAVEDLRVVCLQEASGWKESFLDVKVKDLPARQKTFSPLVSMLLTIALRHLQEDGVVEKTVNERWRKVLQSEQDVQAPQGRIF